MARRGRGEGTVGREGDRWVARVDLPPGPDGKRRRRRRRARTKTEAMEALKEMLKELEEVENPTGTRRTVGEAVQLYMTTRSDVNRSDGTVDIRESRARAIVKGLGSKQIGKLKVVDCDRFLREVAAGTYGRGRPLKADSVRRFKSLLIDVLRNEQRLGNLARNVAELAELPAFEIQAPADDDDGDSSTSIRRILSPSEFHALHNRATGSVQIIIDLCGRCGLRPSEARALRWTRVDLQERTIRIDAQMDSKNRLTKPKTRRSRRTVPIDSHTCQLLTSWQPLQHDQRARTWDRWDNTHDFVATTRVGTAHNGSNLRRSISGLCDDLDLDRYLPYELRNDQTVDSQAEDESDSGHPNEENR